MLRTMTLAQARKAYPIGSTVRVVSNGRTYVVFGHYSITTIVGRRTLVEVNNDRTGYRAGEFTTDQIEAV